MNIIADDTFCKANISETISDEVIQRHYGPNIVVAEVKYLHAPPVQYCLSDVTVTEKLEKFVEDVKYILSTFALFIQYKRNYLNPKESLKEAQRRLLEKTF